MKLRINDTVQVIAGKDKGKSGKVTRIYPKKNTVVVAGVNKYKRHMKRRDAQTPGNVVEVERPINPSKLMLQVGNKISRVGYTIAKNGDKSRIAKKTKEIIDKK